MSEQSKPVTEAEVSGDEQNNAALPAEVVDIFGRVQRVLRDTPWVGVGAACTAMGALILYCYFWSIDFLPPDLTAVIATSAAVAALALVVLIWVLVSLIAPRWAYQSAVVFSAKNGSDPSGIAKGFHWLLVSFQFAGVGLLLLFFTYQLASKCTPGAAYFGVPGGVLALLGFVGWVILEFREHRVPLLRGKRTIHGLLVAFWSLLPFFVLHSVVVPGQGIEWWHLGVFLGVWVGVVLASAALPGTVPVWGLALMSVVALPLLLFSVPALIGQPASFPTKVAELAGIRDRKPSELRVPKSTCTLIQSGLAEGQTSAALKCDTSSEWGSVKAQVLSNLGDRWFIEVPLDAGDKAGGGGSLRITIPGEGVQTIRRIVPKAEPASSCKP